MAFGFNWRPQQIPTQMKGAQFAPQKVGLDQDFPSLVNGAIGRSPEEIAVEQNLNERQVGNANDMFNWIQQGGTPQADAAAAAEKQAQDEAAAKQQRIEEIEAEIAEIEQRIAERKRGMAANEDALNTQLAAIEARKINQNDPTSIWRWKAQMDENRRIANAQNKSDNTAKANALIDANNILDSMIIDDSLDTPTKNAMLSKLADVKSSLEKNGFDTARVNSMISKLKGNGEQTTREQAKTDWKGLKGKPDLTSNEIQTALDNPDMNWDPDERKEAENLRDKLKKHEAATQDVKNMKSWVEKTYGTKWHTLSPRLQETYQRLWKNRKGKK